MNAKEVKQAVKDLIVTNKATLVTDLTGQGVARQITQVTTTTLTPPSGYYFVAVVCPNVTETSVSSTLTARPSKRGATYRIEVYVSDEASVQSMDDEAYETMAGTFDTLVDRIGKLVEEQTWFTTGSSAKLKLVRAVGEDRLVQRDDLSGNFQDIENNWFAGLYARLSFSLIDECVDNTTLY